MAVSERPWSWGEWFRMRVEKDVSPWIYFPKHHRKQILSGPGNHAFLPSRVWPVLPEPRVYEVSRGVFIFILPAAQRKMRIIPKVKLSIQGSFFNFIFLLLLGLWFWVLLMHLHPQSKLELLKCGRSWIDESLLLGIACVIFPASLKPGCNNFWSWRPLWPMTPGREVHGKPRVLTSFLVGFQPVLNPSACFGFPSSPLRGCYRNLPLSVQWNPPLPLLTSLQKVGKKTLPASLIQTKVTRRTEWAMTGTVHTEWRLGYSSSKGCHFQYQEPWELKVHTAV